MVQNVIDPLAAEPLLAEMFCQNRSGHFFQISHLVNGNSAAYHFLQIGSTDIFRFPDFFTAIFLFIFLIHGCNDLPCQLQKDHKFLKSLALL